MHRWTQEEINTLTNHFITLGATEVHRKYLYHIGLNAIRHKAKQLGLSNKTYNWTSDELESLVYLSKECTLEELMEVFPHRSRESIRLKIHRLGLERLPSKKGGSLLEGIPTTLYLVNFGEFFKVGITQQSIKRRLGNYPPYSIVWQLDNLPLGRAKDLEIEILEQVDLFMPDNWLSGKTECFKAHIPPKKPEL